MCVPFQSFVCVLFFKISSILPFLRLSLLLSPTSLFIPFPMRQLFLNGSHYLIIPALIHFNNDLNTILLLITLFPSYTPHSSPVPYLEVFQITYTSDCPCVHSIQCHTPNIDLQYLIRTNDFFILRI